MSARTVRSAAIASALLSSAIAVADERYFVYTNSWFTPSKFEKEIELHWRQFEGGTVEGAFELEYGISDRYLIAPYFLFVNENGRLKTAGWKLEQRYRFGKFAFKRVLPTVYFEVKREKGEPTELEGKLIGTYVPNQDWIVSGNLIVEKKLVDSETAEVGYSVGVAKLDRSGQIGVEAFGNWKDNEHFVGPTFGFGSASEIKFLATVGLPITSRGTKQIRFLLEHEF